MKRSAINHILKDSETFLKEHQVFLPPFGRWSPKQWQKLDESYQEITDNMLGWDVTDFGSGNFREYGLVAFTFRNGNYKEPKKYPKPYCEKVLLLKEGQELPYHFHRLKEEDTINRGGGNLQITVWNATKDEDLDEESLVHIVKDGHRLVLDPGTVVTLHPGESLTTTTRIYHKWNVEPNSGDVMVWEVSSTNDDNIDNRFLKDIPRVPDIDEDEAPYRLLFGDYKKLV
ncbi:D-lyxose/D-mannose family sugar isomerase [Lacticaseibacillus zeae]|uniref:D-lyxose ketol-isomerase n=1 Tax=Lacticaseibacillus zeae TaxID=57037 RepID=A0A5R8LNS3_LACZE|nr:D-lyxose/D-mannose family sugar isomerase [Lacticaseibacillus zeae]TLF38887.1 D-lyxose/D-mannose family sugar isomerase [Lacticaseibacillus zeae]